MNNTGQRCVARKRFIVVEELATGFSEEFQGLGGGAVTDPMDEATTLGPLSDGSGPGAIAGPGQSGCRQRRYRVMGGKRIDRPGTFMQPTI